MRLGLPKSWGSVQEMLLERWGGPVLGDEGVVAPRELPERRIPQACLDVLATVWH